MTQLVGPSRWAVFLAASLAAIKSSLPVKTDVVLSVACPASHDCPSASESTPLERSHS